MQQTLAQKTLAFWTISSKYNGRIGKGVTCEEVNRTCNNIYPQLNPARPLFDRLFKFQQEIIRGPEPESVNSSAAN